jgi:hypothetical protein
MIWRCPRYGRRRYEIAAPLRPVDNHHSELEGFHVKDRLVTAAVCATLLAVAPSLQAQGQPAPSQPARPAAPQRQSALADRLKTALSPSFRVNMTRVEDQSLQVAIDERRIEEDTYLRLVIATCTSVGAEARQLKEMVFANRFAMQGYSFKAPAKCADILKIPADQQKAAVFADTEAL